ncbi:hypothetical protein [Pasteuria penetrans]|uniref:hypothetical protein n=1 Tax=Pasteuria penetrans TaxID=86005 RepID=UPI000FB9D7F5|nr:hypothetical protein [Pasteuria penetrans]
MRIRIQSAGTTSNPRWLVFLLLPVIGKVLPRMIPITLILALFLTSTVDTIASYNDQASSETVTLAPIDENGSGTNWMDQLYLSSGCRKGLLSGTLRGAIGGAIFFGRGRGIRNILKSTLFGAIFGLTMGIVLRCLILDTLWP